MSKTSLFGTAIFGNAVFGNRGISRTVVNSKIISTTPNTPVGRLHLFYSWVETVEE